MWCCPCWSKRDRSGLRQKILSEDDSVETELSAVSSLGTFPSIPITYDGLKRAVRNGLMPDARVYWWPLLPRIRPCDVTAAYPKIKGAYLVSSAT
jgi:hypothetical protein